MATRRSILLATDFRASSQDAAGVTARLATTFGSRVTVLHVREEFLTWPVSPFENQERLAAQLAAQQLDVAEFLVHAGPPANRVVHTAREVGADLLVIGAGEAAGDGRPGGGGDHGIGPVPGPGREPARPGALVPIDPLPGGLLPGVPAGPGGRHPVGQ